MLDSESDPPPVFETVTDALSDVIGAVIVFAPFHEVMDGMFWEFWAARKVSDPPFGRMV
jgi:hypothetical protein